MSPLRRRGGSRALAGFDASLEAAQIFAHLLISPAEERGQGASDTPAGGA